VLESAVALILDLIRQHGPLVFFLAAFLENAAFISWAIPGETLLAVGGYFIQRGEMRFELAWLSVFLGVLCGDHVGYLVGRYCGTKIVHRLPYQRVIVRVEKLVGRYGGWVVLCGRFSGGLRPAVLFTVGMMGLPYRKFWPFELVGAAAWSALWLGIGVLGGSLLDYFGELGPWGPWLFFGSIVIGGFLSWLFRDRLKRLILGKDEVDESPILREPAEAISELN
jgi:membrane-associated protein